MQPMLHDARAACAALSPGDESLEACMARIALWMASCAGAGERARGSCAPRSRWRATRACWKARRSCGGGLSKRPSFCARRARPANPSSVPSAPDANAGWRVALAASLHTLARDEATTDRWPAARAHTTKESSWPMTRGSPARSAPGSQAWLARGAQGREQSCREHAADALALAREHRRGLYGIWASGGTRRGSSSRSGVLPRLSTD